MDIKTRKETQIKIMSIVTELNSHPEPNVVMAQQRLLDAANWLERE